MTKPLIASPKTTHRALFLRKKLYFTPKNAKKPLKTPPAVDYRGIFDQKKYAVKEPDPETGLYYYGARYLDPKTSRWISGDPALGEYLPVAPLGDEEKKRNSNLPGQGGVFNYVNLHVYHYAGNNPVKYVDPDGEKMGMPSNLEGIISVMNTMNAKVTNGSFPGSNDQSTNIQWLNGHGNPTQLLKARVLMGTNGIPKSGPCLAMSYLGIAQSYAKKDLTPEQVHSLLNDPKVYNGEAGTAKYVITLALETLGVDTSNMDIRSEISTDGKAAKGAFATIRGVGTYGAPNSSSGHFRQGTSTGDFKWDPFDGSRDTGRKEGELRSIFIRIKPVEE